MIAARQVGPADAALEKHVPRNHERLGRTKECHMARRMSWNMDDSQFILAHRDDIPSVKESRWGRSGFARDAVHLPLPGRCIEKGEVCSVQLRCQAEATMHPSQAQYMVDMCVCEQATHQTEPLAR